MKKITILGAGLAGLGAGIKLAGKETDLTIIEKQNYIGGLAASFRFNDCFFDFGPHTFHARSKEFLDFFMEVMDGDINELTKNVMITFQNKKLSYPIKPINLLANLNISTILSALLSYTQNLIIKDNSLIVGSLEEFYISLYGRKLYELFFEKYTQKVWGIHPKDLSNAFLKHRIPNRTLIQLAVNSIIDLFGREKNKLTKDNYVTSQYYPIQGSGTFPMRIDKLITKNYGTTLLNHSVKKIIINKNKVKEVIVDINGSEISMSSDICISTIPVTTLLNSIEPHPPENILKAVNSLRYRAILIACIVVNTNSILGAEYMYFHQQIFNRVGQMNYFSQESAPKGKCALTAEITCFPEDEIWSLTDEEIIEKVLTGLENEGYDIKRVYSSGIVLRTKFGYPIPTIDYEEQLINIYQYLNKIENLYSGGRQALFTYIQMFQALEMGFTIADYISSGKPKPELDKPLSEESPLFV